MRRSAAAASRLVTPFLFCDGMGLLEVRAHHVHQLVCCPCVAGVLVRAPERVFPDMVFEDFRHKTVHCASRGGDHAEHLATLNLLLQGPNDGIELATDPRHPLHELGLVTYRMGHVCSIAPYGIHRQTDGSAAGFLWLSLTPTPG